MFPPLISEELWNDAHDRLSSRKRESKSGFVNIFAGLLKCDKCGHAICISNAKGCSNYFICNTYTKKGSEYCTSHYTLYDDLYAAVLNDIRQVVSAALYNKEEFVRLILDKIGDQDTLESKHIEQEIKLLEDRIAELEKKFDRLYDDRLDGILSDKKFKEMSSKCEAEQDNAVQRLNELKSQIADKGATEEDTRRFIQLAEEYGEITELDGEMLNHLVSKIVVSERVKDGQDVVQKIKVYYRFIGAV